MPSFFYLERKYACLPQAPILYAQSGNVTEETVPATAETSQLTTVVTSGAKQMETGAPKPYFASFYENVNTFPDQGLRQVLERKYQVAQYTWSSVSGISTHIGTVNFPYALIQTSTQIAEKLEHFHYFRADVEIEIHVAGTQYHQGALIAAIHPFTTGAATHPKLVDTFVMSTCDHVHVSPDSNTTTKITIPYLHMQPWWNHADDENYGYFGQLTIRVLNPLIMQNSKVTQTLPVTVFARFVNPQVTAPTLHSSTSLKALKAKKNPPLLTPQGNEAVAKSSAQIISKTLESDTVTHATTAVDSVLAPMAQAVGGALRTAAAIGGLIGLDKPDNVGSVNPVYLQTTNGLTQMNGMNTQYALSMDVDNKISNAPEDYRMPVQETQLSYLQSQPGLFATGNFNATATTNSVIVKWHNSPCVAPATTATIQHIPCSAIASQFQYWQGDMKYCIYMKTSKFTICKVRVSWHPTMSETVLSPEGSGDFPSIVFDVCGDVTIPFTVPYLKDQAYCTRHDPRDANWTEEQYAGAVVLSVVNPIAPMDSSVYNQIVYYNIYAAASPDMDFQMPFTRPVLGETPDAAEFDYIDYANTTFGPPLVPQGDVPEQNTLTPVSYFKGEFPSLYPATSYHFNKVVSGEKVSSVLDLLHRFQRVENFNITPETVYYRRYPQKNVSLNVEYNYQFNYFRYWSYFARGGISYKITPGKLTNANLDGTFYAWNASDPLNTYSSVDLWGRDGVVMENMHFKPSLEFTLCHYSTRPYWWKEHYYPANFDGTQGSPIYNGFNFMYLPVNDTESSEYLYHFWLALRDDASMGYFKGCPKVTTYQPPALDANNNRLRQAVGSPSLSLRPQ